MQATPGMRLLLTPACLTAEHHPHPLPAKCPELNPVENIWQSTRGNWLSSRLFLSYDNILDHCCYTWNRLVDQPWF
jgi:transposase